MEKIDKEKFVKDIEDSLGVKKYEDMEKDIEKSRRVESIDDEDFKDFGEIISKIYEQNKEYEPYELDIQKTCKITEEEAKNGCKKILKIKKKIFNKKENRFERRKEEIEVDIPKGIKEGQAILVYGEGNMSRSLKRGRLVVKIVIK